VLGASALTVSAALQEMYRFNQATIVAHQAQATLAAKTSALFKEVMDETGRAAELSNEVTALKQRNKDLEDDLAQARKEVKSLKERFGEVAKVMGFGVGTAENEDDA
jgi:predicted  nucleic acid-binding Zn-ribbon protein